MIRESLAMTLQIVPEDKRHTAGKLVSLGYLLEVKGKPAEAEKIVVAQAVQINRADRSDKPA